MPPKKKSDCYTKRGGHCAVKGGRGRRATKRAPSAAVQAKKYRLHESDIKALRKLLPKGSSLATIEGRGSTQAVSRIILLLTHKSWGIYDASFGIAQKAGWGNKLDRDNGGIKQGGYGTSRSYEVVYRLSDIVWGDGYAIKQNRV